MQLGRGQGQGLTLEYCYRFVRKLLFHQGLSKEKCPSERWQRSCWLVQDKFHWREVNVKALREGAVKIFIFKV